LLKSSYEPLLPMNSEAVQDWLRIRRELLAREAEFTSLAIRVANGEESEALLQEERLILESSRELCGAAYRRAFPKDK
jgi:hypothetical protein